MIGCNPSEVVLEEGESLHDLQIHSLYLIQKKSGYCFTSDSVLLANFVKFKKTDMVVELCAGSGVVSVLACAKNPYSSLTAIELQSGLAQLAQKNFAINHLKNASVICDSVQNAPKLIGCEVADVVLCNPPFFPATDLTAKSSERAIARKEIALSLPELVSATASLLKYGGTLYMVHQTERLPEVLGVLAQHNLTAKELQLVQPKANKGSNIFLIKATKGGRPGLKMLPTLVMYDQNGKESPELQEIYQRKTKK